MVDVVVMIEAGFPMEPQGSPQGTVLAVPLAVHNAPDSGMQQRHRAHDAGLVRHITVEARTQVRPAPTMQDPLRNRLPKARV